MLLNENGHGGMPAALLGLHTAWCSLPLITTLQGPKVKLEAGAPAAEELHLAVCLLPSWAACCPFHHHQFIITLS